MNGENGVNEHEPEPLPETAPGEESGGGNETVEELEDRLIIALERNEQLEQRIAALESRLAAIESNGNGREPVSEGPSVDTTPANNRQPDTPPRPAHIWYKRLDE
jgi:hypothetical protein